MEKVIYLIYWDHDLVDSYLYGSRVTYQRDGSVSFVNELMPSGRAIREWTSRMNYQHGRLEPQLPILVVNQTYRLRVFAKCEPEGTVLTRIEYLDRRGDSLGSQLFTEKEATFELPEGTYNYTLQLVQAGAREVLFHHMEIEPVYEDQESGKGYSKIFKYNERVRKLYILLPELRGRMVRFPEQRELGVLNNIVYAPTCMMLPEPFFSIDWLHEPLFLGYDRYTLVCYGTTAVHQAIDLAEKYTKVEAVMLGAGGSMEALP